MNETTLKLLGQLPCSWILESYFLDGMEAYLKVSRRSLAQRLKSLWRSGYVEVRFVAPDGRIQLTQDVDSMVMIRRRFPEKAEEKLSEPAFDGVT